MKSILLVLLVGFCTNIFAQHSISLEGGATVSNLQKYGSKIALEDISKSEMFDTKPFYFPYLGLSYEFDWHPFCFSTGLSFLTMGATDLIIKNTTTSELYLNLPVLVGRKWDISADAFVSAKIGAEFGLKIINIGELVLAKNYNQLGSNIGAVGVIEGVFKNFKLGARLHIGLTNYYSWKMKSNQEIVDFKHSSLTIYLGYILWRNKNK